MVSLIYLHVVVLKSFRREKNSVGGHPMWKFSRSFRANMLVDSNGWELFEVQHQSFHSKWIGWEESQALANEVSS